MMEAIQIEKFKAGQWIRQYRYKSFSPVFINRQWLINDPDLQTLLAEASRYLGELNAFSYQIPDIDFFIRMHVVKEAVTSSRIEGTQTNMEEAFLKENNIQPEKRDDWHEVQNYIQAMNSALERMQTLPLSNRLIRETHKTLLASVRGEHRQPGEFRKSQNWIGGASIRDAVFIPPQQDEVPELMSDLEKFLNNDQIKIPELLRIAIAHYQFETIHPFLDGNGRVGRLLITLHLVSNKILERPALYLSDFFERNKTLYYDNLMGVRLKNDMRQWLKFFLVGVIKTAKSSIFTFQSIIALKDLCDKDIVRKLGRRAHKGLALMEWLYCKPLTTAAEVSEWLNVSQPTANTLIRYFCNLNILHEMTGYKRNRIFVFRRYLEIFKS